MTVAPNRKRKFTKSTTSTSTSTSTSTTNTPIPTIEKNVGIKYSCDFCYKDISCTIRFQCAECGSKLPPSLPQQQPNPSTHEVTGSMSSTLEEVDLCVECFAAGVSFNSHLPTHPYRILNPLDFPIYKKDWRADEELLLLEAIESLGLGNWEDLSEQLGNKFTPEVCKEHYIDVYLHTKKDNTFIPAKRLCPSEMYDLQATLTHQQQSTTPSPKIPTPQSIPANHEIVGYMPGRGGDCEIETENDAETTIKDLQFSKNDKVVDRVAKLSLLEIYSSVLDRRAAKHSFIRTHKLDHYRRQQALDRARSKEEREIHQVIRPLAPHIDAKYYQLLVEGLLVEKDIRNQIERLQSLREVGVRTLQEGRECEAEKRTLDHFLRQAAQTTMGVNGPSSSSSSSGVGVGVNGGNDLIHSSYEKETPHPLPTPIRVDIINNDFSESNISSSISSQSNLQQMAFPTAGRKASTPLNISHAEGVELLSEKERHICSILRLYPNLYLSIKDTLIKEYIKQGGGVEGGSGGLKRAQARAAVKIDVNKTSKLYDFFVAAGWIKPPASGE